MENQIIEAPNECNSCHISEKCVGKPLDIYVVVDISKSINDDELKQESSAVRYILQQVDIGKDKSRAGIIKYHKFSSTEFDLSKITSQSALAKAKIVTRPVKIGGTRTDLGLIEMEKNFKNESNADRKKVAIVVTDGKATVNKSILKKVVDEIHKTDTMVLKLYFQHHSLTGFP